MNFTAENIYKWASENQETLFRWLQPHGGKSLLLNNELKKGPALFLFIPFDPLAQRNPLLDEVGVLVVLAPVIALLPHSGALINHQSGRQE